MEIFQKNIIFVCDITSSNNIKPISTTLSSTHEGRRSTNGVKRRKEEEEEESQRQEEEKKKNHNRAGSGRRKRIATGKKKNRSHDVCEGERIRRMNEGDHYKEEEA